MTFPRMDPDKAQLLVDALRSGKYKQGGYALRPTTDTYCCLGVATDLAAQDGACRWGSVDNKTALPHDAQQGEIGALIPDVSRWLGLPADCKVFNFIANDEFWDILSRYNINFSSSDKRDTCEGHIKKNFVVERDNTINATFLNDEGVPFAAIADLIEAQHVHGRTT